ncbi:FAD/NAD(P)-binding domain-containing protein [Trichoderma camerunense]
MNEFLAATAADVARFSANGFYDYIIVGSGIGGGVLARTLIEEGEKKKERGEKNEEGEKKKKPRVLLIEQGGLMFSTHCLNASRPHWNQSISEGPFEDNNIVFNAVKETINTATSRSHEYVGGPVHCIGGRSNVWGLYTPMLHKDDAKKYFPRDVCSYLFNDGYNEAYRLLTNNPNASLDVPYPRNNINANVNGAIDKVIGTLNQIEDCEFTCCPMAAEFTSGERLYHFPMGAYSTVNWILNRVYNRDERLTVLSKTQVITVNRSGEGNGELPITSLTVRDSSGQESKIPVSKGVKVILSAGTIGSADIALRSGIGNGSDTSLVGKGLMEHDLWGARFEIFGGETIANLNTQPLKLQSWVRFGDCDDWVLLDLIINTSTFLGATQDQRFPTVYLGHDGRRLSKIEVHKLGADTPRCTIQVVYEFSARLKDMNRVLVLPEPTPTLAIECLDDNSEYLEEMRGLTQRIGRVLAMEQVPLPNLSKAGFGAAAHEVGTMRMGGKPGSRVVDADLKVDGFDNLFVCDLSVFPVSPAANPTLTLTALAQRLGKHLLSL